MSYIRRLWSVSVEQWLKLFSTLFAWLAGLLLVLVVFLAGMSLVQSLWGAFRPYIGGGAFLVPGLLLYALGLASLAALLGGLRRAIELLKVLAADIERD